MLVTIVRKELREIGRDPFAVAVLAAYIAILTLSCATSRWAWTERVSVQASRQRLAREAWLGQTNNSPHQATHDGTTVFKLPSPLASVDPGVDPELGDAVRLESHQRHEATDSFRRDQLRLLRLDFTTPALLVQAVLPLVIILLSHAMVSGEQERGRWGLLASLGVTQLKVGLGKLIAALFVAAVMSSPVLVTLIWTATQLEPQMGMALPDLLWRSVALYSANLLYLAVWCVAGSMLTARFPSGVSLMVLIACWAGFTLIIPRLAVDLAYSRFPLPSRQSMLESRAESLREGSDGRRTLADFNAALERQLLNEYGVSQVEDLPVNLNAARLLAMEELTDSIDDQARRQLSVIYQKQDRFIGWFEALSPYLAIRAISTSLAGTDRHHHSAFVDLAERHRRVLVKTMNTAEMKGSRPGSTAESARRFWSQVPEFQQRFPSLMGILETIRWPLGLLVVTCLLMTTLALLPLKWDVQ